MIKNILEKVKNEVFDILCLLDERQAEASVQIIRDAPRLYIAGAGRSGLVMRAFAMRLMQAGFEAYLVGDTVTPAAGASDLLVIGSISGKTESLKVFSEQARKLGMKRLVLTGHPDSFLGRTADLVLLIPVGGPVEAGNGALVKQKHASLPLGSVAEICLFICTDALIRLLMDRCGIEEGSMRSKHANLE
jgi:6-phospho-3-hexuloisomerase